MLPSKFSELVNDELAKFLKDGVGTRQPHQILEGFITQLQATRSAMAKADYEQRLPKATQDVQDAARRGYEGQQ